MTEFRRDIEAFSHMIPNIIEKWGQCGKYFESIIIYIFYVSLACDMHSGLFPPAHRRPFVFPWRVRPFRCSCFRQCCQYSREQNPAAGADVAPSNGTDQRSLLTQGPTAHCSYGNKPANSPELLQHLKFPFVTYLAYL